MKPCNSEGAHAPQYVGQIYSNSQLSYRDSQPQQQFGGAVQLRVRLIIGNWIYKKW